MVMSVENIMYKLTRAIGLLLVGILFSHPLTHTLDLHNHLDTNDVAQVCSVCVNDAHPTVTLVVAVPSGTFTVSDPIRPTPVCVTVLNAHRERAPPSIS